MAKIIRCPNCGENVEVPANPTGQIVTCIACGTAMRLKSRKDAGDPPRTDPSAGSLSGSLGGTMSATQFSSDAVETSPDDPPSLGAECGVCGRPTDPSELVEDRGHLTCRDCIKGARSSRARTKSFGDEELIPFRPPDVPSRRGRMITFSTPFFAAVAALVVYVACDLILVFNPKPIGTGVTAKTPDEPAPSTQTAWDAENLGVILKMMEEANALKADPNRLAEARQRYEAVVNRAKGQSSGSQEVRRLVDLAEQEADALRLAAVPAPPEPAVPIPPATPPVEVPDTVAAAPNSVFDDMDVAINDKLNGGMTDLEAAVTAGDAAAAHAAEAAMVKFSEARELLIREKRNLPEDPGWTLANHGTAVGYIYVGNYRNALMYLDRLPSPPDHAALLNRVVTLLQMRENKGEAIALLIDHLGSDAGADDNYALNLLGATLARYPDDVITQDPALSDARQKYEQLVKKLGANHPGERRWGTRWIGINEWEARDKERRIQNNRIEDLERALTKVRGRIVSFQKQVDSGTASAKVRASLMADQGEEQALLTRIQTERAKIPPEEWLTPEQIVPVLPDVTAVNVRNIDRAATGPATNG